MIQQLKSSSASTHIPVTIAGHTLHHCWICGVANAFAEFPIRIWPDKFTANTAWQPPRYKRPNIKQKPYNLVTRSPENCPKFRKLTIGILHGDCGDRKKHYHCGYEFHILITNFVPKKITKVPEAPFALERCSN